MTRLRTFWQKARRLDRDLKERGASRSQRISMLSQKARAVIFPPGSRRYRMYEAVIRPLARPLLRWADRNRQDLLPLWDRWDEFQPVEGEIEDQETLAFPEHASPRCSILVPVYGKWRHTYTCLRAILRNTRGPAYEVIVLDDASPDETPRLAEIVRGVRFVRQPENLGFLRNCNEGAKHARGETLLLLNNDACPEPGWLEALHAVLDEDPRAGLVGARLLDANGRLQEAGGIVWRDGSGWNFGRGDDPSLPQYGYRKPADYCSGACILVPAELWRRLGGFDERYAPAYYEDTDLAFAVRAAGRECVYQPRATVVHLEGVSHGTDAGGGGLKRFQEINRKKFEEKWRETLASGHAIGPDGLFAARDRSAGARHVFVADAMVPAWDAEAGARLTYLYVRLLAEEGFRVHFAPANLFPAQPHTALLEDLGVEVLHGHEHGERHSTWLARNGRHLHAAFLHRPDVADACLPHLKEHAPQARIVYQCHDLHHVREQRRHAAEGGRGEGREAARWRAIEERVLRAADVVHTPSAVERDWILEHFPGRVVRDVPVFFWDGAPLDGDPGGADPAGRAGLLFVGGFRHPPNLDGVAWFVREVLPLVRARRPDAGLDVVGAHTRDGVKALKREGVRALGRISEEELGAAYRRARAAVVPLRYGAGVKGKLIESFAWGLPAVATPVGAEGVPGAEDAALVASSPREFADAVLRLLEDDGAWRRARRAGIALVERAYSTARARDIIRADFSPSGAREARPNPEPAHQAAR